MSLHLYEITEQYKQLHALAESDDIPPEVIRDTLESVEGEFKDKAINVAKFILNLEASAETIKKSAALQAARAKRMEARAEQLRQYMLFNFQATSTQKIPCEWFTLAVKNNPPAVAVDDINAVPDLFLSAPSGPPPLRDNQVLNYELDDNDNPMKWSITETVTEEFEGEPVSVLKIVNRGTFEFKPASVVKSAVQKEFKAGREVAGCHPEQGQRLDIDC